MSQAIEGLEGKAFTVIDHSGPLCAAKCCVGQLWGHPQPITSAKAGILANESWLSIDGQATKPTIQMPVQYLVRGLGSFLDSAGLPPAMQLILHSSKVAT